MLQGAEKWALTKRWKYAADLGEESSMNSAVKENGQWQIRTNCELYSLYEDLDLVTEIREKRLCWLEQVERIPENRAAAKKEEELEDPTTDGLMI